MRGNKLTVAIITIVEGVAGIGGGILLAVLSIALLVAGEGSETALGEFLGAVTTFFGILFLFTSLVVLAIGGLMLFFGIKLLSHKPNRGIVITLIVLNALVAASALTAIFNQPIYGAVMAIIPTVVIVCASIYLKKLGEHERQQGGQNMGGSMQQPGMNFDPVTGQKLK